MYEELYIHTSVISFKMCSFLYFCLYRFASVCKQARWVCVQNLTRFINGRTDSLATFINVTGFPLGRTLEKHEWKHLNITFPTNGNSYWFVSFSMRTTVKTLCLDLGVVLFICVSYIALEILQWSWLYLKKKQSYDIKCQVRCLILRFSCVGRKWYT